MIFLFKTLSLLLIISLMGCSTTNSPSTTMDNRFEIAKKSRPQLISFLKEMPKGGDLHNHLDGATFSEYMLKSAVNNALNYNIKTHLFTPNPVGKDVINLEQLKNVPRYFEDYRRHFSMRGWTSVMGPGRDHFFSIFKRIASSGRQEKKILAEVIQRSQLQNITYLELISPVVSSEILQKFQNEVGTFDINNLAATFAQIKDLTINKDIAAQISKRVDGWENYAFKTLQPDNTSLNSISENVTIRYIPYVIRLGSLRNFFVSVASAFTAINADDRVVALNIVAPEDIPDANDLFEAQMKIIDFLWKEMGQPLITLHAGELTIQDATLQSMKNRIRLSIDKGHARRIGHGVSIAWEENTQDLLNQMARDRILVEICLTSNEIILGVSGQNHPFELYRKAGVPLSLNTDDEGVNRSLLTMEFVKATERYNLSYSDLLTLIRNSIEFSFLSGESLFIDGNYDKIRSGFEDFRNTTWQPVAAIRQMLIQNPKLAVQVGLERDITAFEREFLTIK